jgi:alpha,alpha-trehalose phosphorylase
MNSFFEERPPALRRGRLRLSGPGSDRRRVLDLRAGLLHRAAEWESPTRKRVRVRSTRMVSFTQRAVAAIEYEVEAVGDEVLVRVQSGLVANEQEPRRGPFG